jgi:uncharacterized protein with FMN-binding domain
MKGRYMKIIEKLGLALGSAAAFIASHSVAQAATLHDGTFVGGTYDAYYGNVQVQATIQGGQIVGVKALKYPGHNRTSNAINAQALPYLQQEVADAQSGKIDIISGATLTSRAYIKSLRDALSQSAK